MHGASFCQRELLRHEPVVQILPIGLAPRAKVGFVELGRGAHEGHRHRLFDEWDGDVLQLRAQACEDSDRGPHGGFDLRIEQVPVEVRGDAYAHTLYVLLEGRHCSDAIGNPYRP